LRTTTLHAIDNRALGHTHVHTAGPDADVLVFSVLRRVLAKYFASLVSG